MIKLIDFKSDHAQRMVWSLNSSEVEIDEKYHKLLDTLEVPNMSFTATHDNKIICAGGIIPIWDNVYEGWVMGSHLIWNFRIVSAKVIKKGMEDLILKNNVKRLQTAVKKDFTLGHRFAKWLGMEEEGLMRKYQNNEDYIRFARVM
ncbi:MAG: hypothetical protein Unbinned2350contig1001_7 [Prokaryotic dsDNA virus sp.]|nr:MAG: hypothetical protein Unbinned2350contig1001_7 [Prokaryotic dsDNA virus sp.]|tara:strand:+ start:275 stop:712 length:438 start_codon:yes stop_codon:yes gene_type:complete